MQAGTNILISSYTTKQPVLLAALYMFCLNLGIHLLRPGRDSAGINNGIENLPMLFTITFFVVALLNLVLKKVKKYYLRQYIVVAQHSVLIISIMLFLTAYFVSPGNRLIDNIFFIWVSVINLWSISFAWDIISDIFPRQRFLQYFGVIAFAGTVGCVAGYGISILISGYELFFSLLVFLAAFILIKKLLHSPAKNKTEQSNAVSKPVAEFNFFFNYGAMIFLYALVATFLYFQQAMLVKASPGNDHHLLFAQLGFWVNIIAMGLQLFFSSHIIRRAGPLFPVAFIPAVLIGGLLCFSVNSSFSIITILMAFNKIASFSLVRPVRETLLAGIHHAQKSQLKIFFDTVIYRSGDVAGGWLFIGLVQLGFSFNQMALAAIPFCLLWLLAILQMRKHSFKI